MKLTVQKEYHGAPISKKLASNFIELGYGLQVEGDGCALVLNILDRAEQNDGLELDLSAFDVDGEEYGGDGTLRRQPDIDEQI